MDSRVSVPRSGVHEQGRFPLRMEKVLVEELVARRAKLVAGESEGTQSVLTRVLAVAQLKLAWADDSPFYMW